MKRLNIENFTLAFFVGVLFTLMSCNRILDVKNTDSFSQSDTWNDPQLADSYLAGLYRSVMPGGWPAGTGALYGGLALDDYRGVVNDATILITSHPWTESFETSYRNIRNVNVLLEEIEKGTLSEEDKNTIVGQAKFLRAYSYFLLLRVYGGVPLILKPQDVNDPNLEVPRASTKELFDAINSDLDDAINRLKGKKFVNDDYGRIGEAAALAFKGRVALYKASPLFNPSNPYNNAYWQEALTATKTAKESLESMGFGLNDSYPDIWSTKNKGNKEAILSVIFNAPTKTDGRSEACVRPYSQSANCSGSDNPVWSLVKSYPMKDGFPIGSSPKYPYDEQTFWKDRDPRFDATIVYNGSIYETGGISGRRQYVDENLAPLQDVYSRNTGASGRTGLYTKKGLQPELLQAEVAQNSVDWIEIRFAEVLLNYAEAANETGDQNAAIEVVKAIRKRAGVEIGAGNYGITASSRDEVRELILNERLIEFVFEGQRFWDVKRHRKFSALNGMRQEGVEATLKPSFLPIDQAKRDTYQYLPEDFDYKIGPILKATATENTLILPDRFYFAPIPNDQIQKNPKLEQSRDWGGSFNPTLE